MKFDIKNRFTDAVIYTAEIEADENTPLSVRLGLAVKIAVKNRISLSGADLRGAIITRANLMRVDLTNADLTGANLTLVILHWANLTGANLTGIKFMGVDLDWANLTGADLRGVDLTGVNFMGANLTGASLKGANLKGVNLMCANFTMSDLRGVDLTGADLFNTIGNHKQIKTFKTEFYTINKIEFGLQVGCKFYTNEQWNDFSDDEIQKMDGKKALDFWAKYKPILKAMGWL